MKLLTPVLLIIVSAALFFLVTNPKYAEIKAEQARQSQLSEALARVQEVQALKDKLAADYDKISPDELGRLKKMLPENIDNVRLLIEVNNIATQYNMTLQDVSISGQTSAVTAAVGPAAGTTGSIDFGFTVRGNYDSFIAFITQLGMNLRLVDVNSLMFSAVESGLYDYQFTVRTYWLK